MLEVLNSYPGETFIQEHARAIQKHSKKIELIWAFTQTDKTGMIGEVFRGSPPSYAIPNFNRISNLHKGRYMIRYFSKRQEAQKKSVLNLIKKISPDLIHFHFASTAIQWHWFSEELNIPFTFSVRGSDIQVLPFVKENYLIGLTDTYLKAYRIHSVCNYLKEELVKMLEVSGSNKVFVVRTVINEGWRKIQRNPIKGRILSVGRLHWRKGFSDLILAASILKKKNLNFQLNIIGEGDRRKELELMIRDLKLNDHVLLLGKKTQKEIMKYMESTDLFVVSSLYEGFPNVLGEALFSRTPFTTTKCPGIVEIFDDKPGSKLCTIGNPESLAEAIFESMNSNSIRINFSDQINLFKAEKHSDDFESLWNVN